MIASLCQVHDTTISGMVMSDARPRPGRKERREGVWRGHSCPPTPTMSKKDEVIAMSQELDGTNPGGPGPSIRPDLYPPNCESLGAHVLEIPFIEIRKPRSFKPLDSALKNLDTYDWLILTSVNGVEAMWDRIEQMRVELPWKSGPSGPRSTRQNVQASSPGVHSASPPSAPPPKSYRTARP